MNKAINIALGANTGPDKVLEATFYWDISEAYRKTGHYIEAFHYWNEAIKKEYSDQLKYCYWHYISMAKISTKLESHKIADYYIQLALSCQGSQTCRTLESIAKFLTKAGRLEEAEKYIQIADKVSKELEIFQGE